MNIIKKIIMTILPVMLVFMGTASVVYAAPRAELTSFADLSGKTVSMLTGAPFEELVRRLESLHLLTILRTCFWHWKRGKRTPLCPITP